MSGDEKEEGSDKQDTQENEGENADEVEGEKKEPKKKKSEKQEPRKKQKGDVDEQAAQSAADLINSATGSELVDKEDVQKEAEEKKKERISGKEKRRRREEARRLKEQQEKNNPGGAGQGTQDSNQNDNNQSQNRHGGGKNAQHGKSETKPSDQAKLDELNDKIESATGAEKKRLKTQKYRLKRDIERYKKGENHSQNKKDN